MSPEGLTSQPAPAAPAANDGAAEQLAPHALPRVCAKRAQQSGAAPPNKRPTPGAEPTSDASTAETSSPVMTPAVVDLPAAASSEAAAAAADSHEPAASKADGAAASASDVPANLSPQLPSAVASAMPKPTAWTPLQAFSSLQSSPSLRVPFGYVPGAISVEMPKRQRSAKGNPNFPRSYSSLV